MPFEKRGDLKMNPRLLSSRKIFLNQDFDLGSWDCKNMKRSNPKTQNFNFLLSRNNGSFCFSILNLIIENKSDLRIFAA